MDYGKYTLIYQIDDYKVTTEFKGDINSNTLSDNLRYFLLACSWNPKTVDEILGELD